MEPCRPDALLEAVRGLRVAEPDLGLKPLLAKLREQQPNLGTREVREALKALNAEDEAKFAAASPAVDGGGAPSPVAQSLACFGCARLPSDMDDKREKHPVCHKCVKQKVPTTYWCGVDCPGNPGAWNLHMVYHKELKNRRGKHATIRLEDGGVLLQQQREAAERQAVCSVQQTGDKYMELMAEALRFDSKEDRRRAVLSYVCYVLSYVCHVLS